MGSYGVSLSFFVGKLGFKKHEDESTIICDPIEIMPVSR
jgi:hypothetical protein